MDELSIARALHVLAIVHWIGGVSLVTLVLLPGIMRSVPAKDRLQLFEMIEGQFAFQARISTLIAGATVLRIAVSGCGLLLELNHAGAPDTAIVLFLTLRWLAGLVAPLGLAYMTWKTLDIPNTQSATGILYVVVIVTFVGELTAQLLSASSAYPL